MVGLKRRRIMVILMVTIIMLTILMPGAIRAAGFFKGLKRTVGFIIKVPDKLTRPFGPVAPLAQMWLFGKTSKFGQILKKAERINKTIDDVDAQKAKLNEVKRIYRAEATRLRNKADSLANDKQLLEKELLAKGKEFWPAYKENVIALKNLEGGLRKAADSLDKRASDLGLDDVLRLFTGSIARTLLKNAEGAVFHEIGNELNKVVDPRIVSAFISKGGINPDEIIDIVIEGDISRLVKKKGLAGRPDIGGLKERIKKRVREQIKEDQNHFRDNWEEEIDKIIVELAQKAVDSSVSDKEPKGIRSVSPTLKISAPDSKLELVSYSMEIKAEPVSESGLGHKLLGSFTLTFEHQDPPWIWILEGNLYEKEGAAFSLPKKVDLAGDYTFTVTTPEAGSKVFKRSRNSMLIGSLDSDMKGSGLLLTTEAGNLNWQSE